MIEKFSARDNQDYPLFKEAVRLIEEDPDLLHSILILLERGTVSRFSLPLDASPDIGPLELTSLVRKSASNEYTIRNEIYRRFLLRQFNPGRSGNLFMAHGRWDMALDYLEKSLQSGDRAYHSNFLETTLNAMYSAEDVSHAASHFLNGLKVGFGVQQARLWMKVRDKDALRQIHEIGFRGQSLANEISLQGDHIEGRVFREKMPLREQDENNQTRMAFPLAPGRNEPAGPGHHLQLLCPPAGTGRSSSPAMSTGAHGPCSRASSGRDKNCRSRTRTCRSRERRSCSTCSTGPAP